MVLGGWVSLLAACAHVDLGQREAAYASRLTAQRIGTEAKQGRSLRRLATARIDLAVVVADQDRPQEACHLGDQALTSGRLVPSNIWGVAELDHVLQNRYGSVPDVRDFHEHYLEVHAAL